MDKINKIIEYGLYLLVFLLPLQTRWIIRQGGSEYGTLSLYGVDLLLIFLLVAFLASKFPISNFSCDRDPAKRWQFLNKSQVPNSKYAKIIFLLAAGLNLTAFVSFFFAQDKLIAGQAYLRLTLGMGLFWLILAVKYDYLKLIYSFLAGVFLQALLGGWQFLAQASFASKWLGLAAHPAGVGGTSVIETLAGGRWLRAYGGLDHPNVLGGLMVIGILLIIKILLKKKRSFVADALQDDKRERRDLMIFIYYLLFFIFLAVLFFTFSRGAWVGLIVGLIVMVGGGLMGFRRRSNSDTDKEITHPALRAPLSRGELAISARNGEEGVGNILKIVGAGAVLVGILFFIYSDLVTTRLSGTARLEVKSSQERTASLRDALKIIAVHPFTGAGIGNYTQALERAERAEREEREERAEREERTEWEERAKGAEWEERAKGAEWEERAEWAEWEERTEWAEWEERAERAEWEERAEGEPTPPLDRLGAPLQGGESTKPDWFYQPTHNVFLLVWAETGIVGLILFIAILMRLIILNFKFLILNQFKILNEKNEQVNLKFNHLVFNENLKLKIKNSNYAIGAFHNYFNLSFLFALIMLMLPDHYLWSLHFGVLFFWFLLGLMARGNAGEDRPSLQ